MSDNENRVYVPVTERHTSLMEGFKACLVAHRDLTIVEMLAIASQLVGNLSAMQDGTRYTSRDVMDLVSHNISIGNKVICETLTGGPAVGNA